MNIVLIWLLLQMLPIAPAAQPLYPQLAIEVREPGIIRFRDDQLRAAGWSSVPRDRVTVIRQGVMQPLIDEGSGFGFVGIPTDSRWTQTAVYWVTVADTAAPRMRPPTTLPWPVQWEPDIVYERHQQTERGDAWWAGELRGTQRLQARLDVPADLPSSSPLLISVRGTRLGFHTLQVLIDGVTRDVIQWTDTGATPSAVTHTIRLSARPAGPMQVELLGDGVIPILVDRLVLPNTITPPRIIDVPVLRAREPLPDAAGVADLLIVTHPLFRDSLTPLIALHTSAGRRVQVVSVTAVYDTFSAGERDPEAIRRFVRERRPRAVLLVGAGTTALRTPVPERPVYIPPYLIVDPQDGEVACDTCYGRLTKGAVTTQLVPDVPVGRLPVTTTAQAQTVIGKIVQQATPVPGPWQTRALVLADNDRERDGTSDPAGPFTDTAEIGISAVPQGITTTRLYYAPDLAQTDGPREPSSAMIRCRLFRALDGGRISDTTCPSVDVPTSGVALWVYVGHGSPWQWATTTPTEPTTYLWYLYDADARRNGQKLPILLSMTCLSGDFANPTLQANDERLLLHATGGTVASLSSTGEGVNTAHARLLLGAVRTLYGSGDRTIGAAHLAGLRALGDRNPDLAFAITLLGDPLTTLPFVPTTLAYVPLVQR